MTHGPERYFPGTAGSHQDRSGHSQSLVERGLPVDAAHCHSGGQTDPELHTEWCQHVRHTGASAVSLGFTFPAQSVGSRPGDLLGSVPAGGRTDALTSSFIRVHEPALSFSSLNFGSSGCKWLRRMSGFSREMRHKGKKTCISGKTSV